MVPFKFCGLWVGHDSTFEIDIVSFLNISETRKHLSKMIFVSPWFLMGSVSCQGWVSAAVCLKGWKIFGGKDWFLTYTWRGRPSGPLWCCRECSCWRRDTRVSSCYHSRLVQPFIHNWLETVSSWQTFVWVMAGIGKWSVSKTESCHHLTNT